MPHTTGKQLRDWLPAIVVVMSVIVGYVQLSVSVKNNSAAIQRLAVAMERMTELQIADGRHETELQSLRRDLNVIWAEVQSHRAKSTYDREN